jgi:hypothetical protein
VQPLCGAVAKPTVIGQVQEIIGLWVHALPNLVWEQILITDKDGEPGRRLRKLE